MLHMLETFEDVIKPLLTLARIQQVEFLANIIYNGDYLLFAISKAYLL
jgi:hypothetical protein